MADVTADDHPGRDVSVAEVVVKSAVVHTATYFVMGIFAFYAFNYAESFATGDMALLMRPTVDPMVAAGPLLQPVRGALFGVVFFLLRDSVFVRDNGWLIIWAMLAIVGILNPFGPAIGSIEGAIYLKMPLASQFGFGLIEVYIQSLLLALGVFFWIRQPRNRWLTWGFPVVAALAILASLAGIFLPPIAPATS